jgi:hypothetical protein
MVRRVLVVCMAIGISAVLAGPAQAQILRDGKQVGGGIGYAFDEHKDFLVITGIGWIPVHFDKLNIVFTPLVAAPRFTYLPGLDRWQIDLDAIWDIPVGKDMNVKPYMGLGVGITHEPFNTTPVVNFDAGFRYKKPAWTHQFAAEIHYSAGLDFGNSMLLNFIVLFPFGRQ